MLFLAPILADLAVSAGTALLSGLINRIISDNYDDKVIEETPGTLAFITMFGNKGYLGEEQLVKFQGVLGTFGQTLTKLDLSKIFTDNVSVPEIKVPDSKLVNDLVGSAIDLNNYINWLKRLSLLVAKTKFTPSGNGLKFTDENGKFNGGGLWELLETADTVAQHIVDEVNVASKSVSAYFTDLVNKYIKDPDVEESNTNSGRQVLFIQYALAIESVLMRLVNNYINHLMVFNRRGANYMANDLDSIYSSNSEVAEYIPYFHSVARDLLLDELKPLVGIYKLILDNGRDNDSKLLQIPQYQLELLNVIIASASATFSSVISSTEGYNFTQDVNLSTPADISSMYTINNGKESISVDTTTAWLTFGEGLVNKVIQNDQLLKQLSVRYSFSISDTSQRI